MTETDDLSPWAHPRAQHWFRALFERTSFALSLENELGQPEDQMNIGKVRMMLAFAVVLGRPEIWPRQQMDVLKLIYRKSKEYSLAPGQACSGKPLTIKEHRAHEVLLVEMSQEMELLRRRMGISNRKTKMGAPSSWEPFWEGNHEIKTTDASAPWEDLDASAWLRGFAAWSHVIKLVHGTLCLEAQDEPHGIRAASAMVIMFCRPEWWPVSDHHSFDPVLEAAARQLANVKQLFEQKGRINPKLQAKPAFRGLLVSIDQEIRILEARMTEPKPSIPNRPPTSWGDFWV